MSGKVRIRRIEYRPPRGDAEEVVRSLKETGYNLIVASGTVGTGHAFFESKYRPMYPNADPDYIKNLLKLCHENDITIISWVCFNIQDVRDEKRLSQFATAKVHPEWTMKFINPPPPDKVDAAGMCVLSSPYRLELAGFITEILGLGFDGIWFDGFFAKGMPNQTRIGCVCDFCRERFKNDTGLELPSRIDWQDKSFRRWVRWRYDRMLDTAVFLTHEIRKAKPDASVTFNCTNRPWFPDRWMQGWREAIPLMRFTEFASSQHYALGRPQGVLLENMHARLSHSENPEDCDFWIPNNPGLKPPEYPMSQRLHALTAVTNGAAPWFGGRAISDDFKAIMEALAKREPYFGGTELKHCGIVLSQNTRDYYDTEDKDRSQFAQTIFGAYAMLAQSHRLQNFVFDHQLTLKDIKDYKALILPNTACLSGKAAAELKHWVESGGVLIGWYQTGLFDIWGDRREKSVLSDLFGIQMLEDGIATAGYRAEAISADPIGSLPEMAWDLSDKFQHFRVKDAQIFLEANNDGERIPVGTIRSHGSGYAIYLGCDLGVDYWTKRNREIRQLLARLTDIVPQQVTADAPIRVIVNSFLREQEKQLTVHLLNLPYEPDSGAELLDSKVISEFPPAKGITITLSGYDAQRVHLLTADEDLEIERSPTGELKVTVPTVVDHEVVIFEHIRRL